jgi:hypothetical protein
MGNLVNKEITKDDVKVPEELYCLDYIVNTLITKYNYTLVKCEDQYEMINTSLDKKVLKYGDLYVIMFKEEEEGQFIKHLLSPMIEPLCRGGHVHKSYPLTSFTSSDIIFFVGFSHVNICKVISFVSCSRDYNLNSPTIELVCAMKPLQHRIQYIKKKTLQELKVNLGLLLLFKCIQYYKDKGETNIILECHYELINYYYFNLFFDIGVSDKFKYRITSKPENTAFEIVLADDKRIGDSAELSKYKAYDSYEQEFLVKDRKKAFENTLFKMHLNIPDKYRKIERNVERRIENIHNVYNVKDLFDSKEDIITDSPYYNTLIKYT